MSISPTQFELFVKTLLERTGRTLIQFDVRHRPVLSGHSGEYEIDITVQFRILGADFLVLVECKHHRNPMKRADVQVLHDRMRSFSASKGILFSSGRLQSGAIEYATMTGIGLVDVATDTPVWVTRQSGAAAAREPSASDERLVAYFLRAITSQPDTPSAFLLDDTTALVAHLFGPGAGNSSCPGDGRIET